MSKCAFLSKLPHKSTNISSTPPPKHQNVVHPRNSKSENFNPKGTRIVCEYPPSLEVKYIHVIHQLARLTIMANCLIETRSEYTMHGPFRWFILVRVEVVSSITYSFFFIPPESRRCRRIKNLVLSVL